MGLEPVEPGAKSRPCSVLNTTPAGPVPCEGGLVTGVPCVRLARVDDNHDLGKGFGEFAGEVDAERVRHGCIVADDGVVRPGRFVPNLRLISLIQAWCIMVARVMPLYQ